MATAWRKWMSIGLWLVGGALMLATLLPNLGIDRWWVQSLTFRQVHFAVLLCISGIAILNASIDGEHGFRECLKDVSTRFDRLRCRRKTRIVTIGYSLALLWQSEGTGWNLR